MVHCHSPPPDPPRKGEGERACRLWRTWVQRVEAACGPPNQVALRPAEGAIQASSTSSQKALPAQRGGGPPTQVALRPAEAPIQASSTSSQKAFPPRRVVASSTCR